MFVCTCLKVIPLLYFSEESANAVLHYHKYAVEVPMFGEIAGVKTLKYNGRTSA